MAIRCADHQYLYCYSFNQVCLVHSPHMVSSLSGPVQCACGRCHELQVLTQCGPTLDGYVGGVHGMQWQGVLLHQMVTTLASTELTRTEWGRPATGIPVPTMRSRHCVQLM